ncbi:MAG TPA: YgeY family selenium metabolism-linked hydrolase [Acidimicrobiia bacterium]|nr:YgeY family selenium metabolism-linked hydrolase [Acidimicrobiia bacterium]
MRSQTRDIASDREADVVDLLRELVHTPSPSAGEGDVVALITERMDALGYDEVVVDGHGSVVGRIGTGPTSILFDSHIDHVGVGDRGEWLNDPFEPVLDGGVVYGRGACDDKGGMAAMLMGAALAKELDALDGVTLYVVGSVQEEDCDGLALEHLLLHTLPRPDLVVLGEPTRGQVYRGHRGRIDVLVRTRGSSCHASAPGRGRNPVYELAPIVAEIRELNDRLAHHDELGPGTIALTKIECETPSLNAVPSTATIYLDRRMTVGETAETALEEIRALPSLRAVGAEVEVISYEAESFTGSTLAADRHFPTWLTPADHAGVQAAVTTVERTLHRAPEVGCWTFSTNGVASMGKLGIPTIGFGPGDEVHAHSVADQCPVAELVDAVAFYADFPAVYASSALSA